LARPICEGCISIDIRDWRRDGLLSVGQVFRCSWNRLGEPLGSISVLIEDGSAVLMYRARTPGETDWRPVQQWVPIDWSPCRFGGQRAWFRCTGFSGERYCGRRAAILYGPGEVFACRRCYGLIHLSRQETPRFRNISRSRKVRMRLGGSANLGDPFPAKPRGMHRSTYFRHRARGEAADRIAFGQLRFSRGLLRRYRAERSKQR
jgi:hypothetical protein